MHDKPTYEELEQRIRFLEESVRRSKKREAALKDSERNFRALFEYAPIGINKVTADGEIIVVNDTLQRFLGYTEEELRGRHFREWTYPDDMEPSLRLVRRLLTGKTDSGAIEKRYVRKDGKIVWGHTTVSAVRDGYGNVDYFVTMVHDITERKRNDAIIESTNRLFSLVNKGLDLTKTLQLCLEEALLISEMDSGGIYLFDEKGGLRLETYSGLPEEFVAGARFYTEDAANVGLVKAGKPVYARHCDLDAALTGPDRKEALKAFGSIPIYFEKRIIGCLNVASHTVVEVPQYARAPLETLSVAMGLVISRARADHELNTTLKVLLDQREKERNSLEERFSESITGLMPYLQEIRKTGLTDIQKEYLGILESNLKETVRPYKYRFSEKLAYLSPAETQIVTHIKQGYANKEIADRLNLSPRTVEFHRENIRKKLGIKDRKINLKSYLNSLL